VNPTTFLTELKRRNVYRAAVAYGVVAWFLTQLTTQVLPLFEIPNSAMRFVVIALAVGFPIAMLLAWVYEFTPEGIVRTDDLRPAQARSIQRATGRILDFIIIGALLLVIAMLIVGRLPFSRQTGESISQKSIAVLPLVTETLPVAEAARRSLMGIFGATFLDPDGSKGHSWIFAGKDGAGRALERDHAHAYYLPTDEDGDGRLDHLTIVVNAGFGEKELNALDRLREIKSRQRQQSGHPVRVLLLGLGRLEDYLPFPLKPARVWISATPFLAPRFPKKNGTRRDSPGVLASPIAFLQTTLHEELAHLIARRPELQSISIEQITIEALLENGVFRTRDSRGLRPIQFKRYRQKRGDDGGSRRSGFFKLKFPIETRGPIALGHSCHFGLGLFVPERC
jgi:CRISPR-associated protein Csb2